MHEVTSLPPAPVQFLQNMQMTYIPGFGPVPTPPPPPFLPVPVPAAEGVYGSAVRLLCFLSCAACCDGRAC